MGQNKIRVLKYYNQELEQAKAAYQVKTWEKCFYHLERAHILGQPYIVPHTTTHIWMFRVGFHKKDFREVIGQIFRIVTGVVGSALGTLPYGNTGGSNVNPFKPMEVPQDLKSLL